MAFSLDAKEFGLSLTEDLYSKMCYYSRSWSGCCRKRPTGYYRSTDDCLLDMDCLTDNSDDVSIRNLDDEEVKSMESTWHNCREVINLTLVGSDYYV